MSLTCKAHVQVIVEVDVHWCSTDKTLDEFHGRVAREATNNVHRHVREIGAVVGDPKVVTVISEARTVTVEPPKEGT